MTNEEIKKLAEDYADTFRLKVEDGGWFQQKVDDFMAGYNAALQPHRPDISVTDDEAAVYGKPEVFVNQRATQIIEELTSLDVPLESILRLYKLINKAKE